MGEHRKTILGASEDILEPRMTKSIALGTHESENSTFGID